MDNTNDSVFEELVGKYVEYKTKETEFKKLKDSITDKIDELLHEKEKNEFKVYISALNETYDIKYVDRINRKTDLVRLNEILSEELFDEVVTESKTTYLKISPEPKSKPSKSRSKPKDIGEFKPNLIKGKIA